VDKCPKLFLVHISQFDTINYDNYVVNHRSLLDSPRFIGLSIELGRFSFGPCLSACLPNGLGRPVASYVADP
jgi:hypothetical protein